MSATNGTGALALGAMREVAAAALAPVVDSDPTVHPAPVDATHPPSIILSYDDPWLTPLGMGCLYECRLEVICVAARVEPEPNYAALDELVAYVLSRLAEDAHPWPAELTSAPRRLPIGGVEYLAARIVYRVRVSL